MAEAEYTFMIEKIEPSKVVDVNILSLKSEQGNIRAQLELPQKILDLITSNWEKGDKITVKISKEEDPNYKQLDLYVVGRVYLKKEEDNRVKYFISIGGLQFIVTAPQGAELKPLKVGEKVYIGFKKIM